VSGSKRGGGLFIGSPWSQSGTEVHFDLATWVLTNYPAFVGAGVANTFLIHAQDTDLAGGDTGADLNLRPGNGTTDGSFRVQSGDGLTDRIVINAAGTMEIYSASYWRVNVSTAALYCDAAVLQTYRAAFQFAAAVVSPTIFQVSHTGAGVADTLLIHAQDTNLAGADTGGDLHLRPGNGTTDGELELQNAAGNPRVVVDATGNVSIGTSASYLPGSFTIYANGALALFTGGSQRITLNSTGVFINSGDLWFALGNANPEIYQQPDPAVGIAADTMTIRAQDATGGGASVGGGLDLRPGAGATNGQLALQDGNAADVLQVNDADVAAVVPFGLPSYTVAGVPAAGSYTAHMIYVSNESGGAVPAFSDGVNWRRVTDRAIIT